MDDDEYRAMVQRELRMLRAKKEATDLFQKEEAERERRQRESAARERAEQLIHGIVTLLQNYTSPEEVFTKAYALLNQLLTRSNVSEYMPTRDELAVRVSLSAYGARASQTGQR